MTLYKQTIAYPTGHVEEWAWKPATTLARWLASDLRHQRKPELKPMWTLLEQQGIGVIYDSRATP